ncbi:hypothetical protein YDYSG_16270 [Paenibacillus tyrfis]|uniref:hypothetical protein n=1 Tax=Paenibacillus tyrfis TaxID=1501230 RepID=UPI0024900DB9|nr:hypothetical protein [Paenibacillus tyrfis]GLI05597.1 hypothetical protein YDYSG_16270 [Paenibacillus tyrfis]
MIIFFVTNVIILLSLIFTYYYTRDQMSKSLLADPTVLYGLKNLITPFSLIISNIILYFIQSTYKILPLLVVIVCILTICFRVLSYKLHLQSKRKMIKKIHSSILIYIIEQFKKKNILISSKDISIILENKSNSCRIIIKFEKVEGVHYSNLRKEMLKTINEKLPNMDIMLIFDYKYIYQKKRTLTEINV